MYDRKYAEIHSDRTCGGTTTKKLWEDKRASGNTCDCCSSYKEWRVNHPQLAQEMQVLADKGKYYEVFHTEEITVGDHSYVGTIRALSGGPLGACYGVVSSTCDACNALVHGKTSNLNRKLHRSKHLKHPRCEEDRATSSGVNHKYCSAEDLQHAMQSRKNQARISSEKILSLTAQNKSLLHDSWHRYPSAKPFMQTLLETNKLSEFDLNFLSTWLRKKYQGKFFRACR